MKVTKFFYVLKNKKGKYLTPNYMRTSNISKARQFKQYEALLYKANFDQIGNEDKVVKAQTTVTTKEVK